MDLPYKRLHDDQYPQEGELCLVWFEPCGYDIMEFCWYTCEPGICSVEGGEKWPQFFNKTGFLTDDDCYWISLKDVKDVPLQDFIETQKPEQRKLCLTWFEPVGFDTMIFETLAKPDGMIKPDGSAVFDVFYNNKGWLTGVDCKWMPLSPPKGQTDERREKVEKKLFEKAAARRRAAEVASNEGAGRDDQAGAGVGDNPAD